MDSHPLGSHMLDSHHLQHDLPADEPGAVGTPAVAANLSAIEAVFRTLAEEGMLAGVEALLQVSHENLRFQPASAEGRVLDGHDQVRAFFSEAEAAGRSIRIRPRSFEEHGDEVVVGGSMRMMRPDGSFAERQVRWTFRFRDGLLEAACWSPRHSD